MPLTFTGPVTGGSEPVKTSIRFIKLSDALLFVLVLWCLGCGALNQDRGHTEAANIERRKVEAPPERQGERLREEVVAGEWILSWQPGSNLVRPREASLVLVAKRGDRQIEIVHPDQAATLPGFKLTTAEQALQFIRLFTGLRSVEPRAFEFPDGSAVARGKGAVFTISRKLVYTGESAPFTLDLSSEAMLPLYQVKETVRANGAYRCEKVRLIRWISEASLNLPSIE